MYAITWRTWHKYRGSNPFPRQHPWASGFLISAPSDADTHSSLRITVVKDENSVWYSDSITRVLSFSQALRLSVSVCVSLPRLLLHCTDRSSGATFFQLMFQRGTRSVSGPAFIMQSALRISGFNHLQIEFQKPFYIRDLSICGGQGGPGTNPPVDTEGRLCRVLGETSYCSILGHVHMPVREWGP